MSGSMVDQAIVVAAGEGRPLWRLGALLSFKALSGETGGRCWALEGLADQQMAVPLHIHSHEAEIWYVLEGEVTLTIGEERRIAEPGGFAYIPAGTAHTFQALTPTIRWFGMGVPGGLNQWFFETGVPAGSLTLPPPPSEAPDVEAIVASLKRYGTETVGPPPGV